MNIRVPDFIATAFTPVMQHWHRLPPRQQRLATAGGTLLVIALLFAYVWLPAVRERDRLEARLPQLRAQLALMQQQAEQIRQLNSTSAIAPAPPTAADIATLQAVFGEGTRVSIDPGRIFRIVIPRIAYSQWWDRIGEVQARHQLQLVALTLQALPGSGREVSVEMAMAEPRQGNPATPAGSAN
jgi:type II secretory pathway component PulM